MQNDRLIKCKVTMSENSLSINACYKAWNYSHVATWLQFPLSGLFWDWTDPYLALNPSNFTEALRPHTIRTSTISKGLGKVGWK